MSIIIRLQNLPWEANSLDIRRYFQGLSIPDGGVHIVGGEKGDAFIAFASDEDARQAMGRDSGAIKDNRVKLFLSSRNEMQRVIEQARNQTLGIKTENPVAVVAQQAAAVTGLLPTPAQVPGLVNSVAPEVEVRRRSPEGRGRRGRSRSPERNRLRNRSRSRSPFPVRVEPPLARIHNGSSHSHLEDVRINQMQAELRQASSLHPTNLNGGAPGSGYNNMNINMNGPTIARSRFEPVARPVQAQVPLNSGLGADVNRHQWPQREEEYRRLAPTGGVPNERLLGHALGDERLGLQPQPGPVLSQPQFVPNQIGLNTTHVTPAFRVEMRGLPFRVIARDIQEFFRVLGLYIPEDQVKILVDDRGFTTGGAIVRLASDRELDAALSMNGRYMSDSRIDVMPLLENLPNEQGHEMMRHPSQAPPSLQPVGPSLLPDPAPQRDYVVYMKGIPYNSCTDRDVANFFQGLRIIDIVFETDSQGKPAGNAYVEFEIRDHYNAALELNMRHMGRRYIEVFPTTKEDMNEARPRGSGAGGTGGVGPGQAGNGAGLPHGHNGPNQPKPTYCISVNGLPQTVTNRDLTSYFQEVGSIAYAIHIMLKPNGYNAGEAFIEFLDMDHQLRALRRDGETIGGHRIAVKSVPFELMRSIVGLSQPNNPPPTPPPVVEQQRPMAGLLDLPDNRLREKVSRGARVPDDHRRVKEERNDRRLRPNLENALENDPFSDPRCVVIATNIPYRATNEDIAVFFADFEINPNGVVRRFNEKGQATADAQVAFNSAEDANRAVRQMHKKFLIGRPVFLRHLD